MMRILCCGDRNWTNKEIIARELSKYTGRDAVIIHGNANGADRLCAEYALNNSFTVLSFPAKWKEYGKAAGSIRNTQMLDEGNPDLVIAFHAYLPNSKGTKNMVEQAKKRGIPVIVIEF